MRCRLILELRSQKRPHEDAIWRGWSHQEYRDWLEDDPDNQLMHSTIRAALVAAFNCLPRQDDLARGYRHSDFFGRRLKRAFHCHREMLHLCNGRFDDLSGLIVVFWRDLHSLGGYRPTSVPLVAFKAPFS
jgi:hypothetical protein